MTHPSLPVPLPPAPPESGLSDLGKVELDEFYRGHFDTGVKTCCGAASFRKRKETELHDYLALSQISRRIDPLAANLEDSLQLHFILHGPVPVKKPDDEIVTHDWAHVHLTYREEAMRQAQPGPSFIQVMMPQGIWLPNVTPPGLPGLPGQRLCLGGSLPPGIRVRELILMTFGALSMQSVQMSEFDPAGVLNIEAARWWQHNRSKIPLTDEPFLRIPS